MIIHRKHRRPILVLSAAAGLQALAGAGAALLNSDLYTRVMPRDLILGSLGMDVVTFAVAVALLAVLRSLSRGAEGLWLIWLGLQAYLLYAYALYAFGRVYTPLYLVYLGVVGSSAYALATFGRALDLRILRNWRVGKLPRRLMGVMLVAIACVFGVMWTGMLVSAIMDGADLPGATVIVLDLAFALPALAFVGALLFLKRPVGDLLAPAIFGMSAAITLGVAIAELLRPAFGQPLHMLAALLYLLPAAVCLAFAVLAFVRVAPAMKRVPAT
jgi:hypothetical protein